MIQFVRLYGVMVLLLIGLGSANAFAYSYEKLEIKSHIIHKVTLNPIQYDINIVKANDGGMGRETVPSIAKRSNATISINGGFFEIGDKRDGVPSGTLVIKGHAYKIKDQTQPLLVIDLGKLSIIQANPKSMRSSQVSMVSGIPILIRDGELNRDIVLKNNPFYTKPHARTAIGLKSDGTIIINVIEHYYSKDLTTISMGEVQSIMKEKGAVFSRKYHHQTVGDITLDELKEILKEEYTPKQGAIGLTILELAQLMKEQGCIHALNLDGGGSSTLCINGKVMNETIGDVDEGNSLKKVRGVSDAIVFREK